jgi:signal transduction histidine kinase
LTIEQTLRIAADSAQNVIGSRTAVAVVMARQYGLHQHQLVVSSSQRARPAPRGPLAADLAQVVLGLSKPARLDATQLAAPSISPLFPDHSGLPFTSGLLAPLVARDASNMGLLMVAGKRDGQFGDDDEALLVQLAQMAATAVENTLFAEAREANRIKDEFLATLSHELRTPLSSILGWAQLLRSQMLDPEETLEAFEIIERNAQIQCKLIEDLLDVSRIVTGKMQLSIRPIDLATVVQAAVNVVLPSAQAKQVRIEVVVEDDQIQVDADADRLQQVFWNLLSNAVKFTPAYGHIDVHLETVGQHVEIRVQDDGEGIAPEFLPHVFDRFRQADSSTSRRHGGLGIGLAIVRHVVELHGGAVAVHSEGMGLGTTFVVSLLVARAAAMQRERVSQEVSL